MLIFKFHIKRPLLGLLFLVLGFPVGVFGGSVLPLRQRVLGEADRILNLANVSYVWGGQTLGSASSCDACTACLSRKQPHKNKRMDLCPICQQCSLDCSNFISLVFRQAGLRAPYLTTQSMRQETPRKLRENYGWIDLGQRVQRALPGDVLVYPGHAVIVETIHRPGIGDIIHTTSGREVKGPGQGVQRQTLVSLQDYRGPLQKVLRHEALQKELRQILSSKRGRPRH